MTGTGIAGRLIALLEIVAVFAGLFALAVLIGGLVLALNVRAELAIPAQALAMWGAVLVGGLFLRREGRSYRDLGLRRPDSWRRTMGWAIATVVVSFAGAGAIAAGVDALTDWPPIDVGYIRGSVEGNVLVWAVWMILVVWGSAAFGEELFARGFLVDRLRRLAGEGRAAIVFAAIGQAAIFGLLHAIQGPTGVLVTGYVGLVMAAAYFGSGRNLWAPILAHGTIDSISLTLMFLGVDLTGASAGG